MGSKDGTKARYMEQAEKQGKSFNQYVVDLIENDIKKEVTAVKTAILFYLFLFCMFISLSFELLFLNCLKIWFAYTLAPPVNTPCVNAVKWPWQ